MATPHLFTPIALRGVTARNRIALSPMCQYSATGGFADDWHLVHLGKFAQGGAGIVFVEATAVEARGRITHGDVGLWSDAHAAPLGRIADFLAANGAVPAIQLAHAGRKASMQRPWQGNGPMTAADQAGGETAWPVVAASAIPLDDGWLVPEALDAAGMETVRQAWRAATLRAADAGFGILDVHSAHGYLLHSFLSPLTNRRNDAHGGDLAGRMRFPLSVVETVREAWPADRPLFVRISAVDGMEGGWTVEDSVAYARELKARGVDVVDCSTGGLAGSATLGRSAPRGLGFQVPYAERIRADAGIATMAVGLIVDAEQAEAILARGQADIIAIGRELMNEPNWPVHAARALGLPGGGFDRWPRQYGWWLERRQAVLDRIRSNSADEART
ncbi:2,4-dienoyl-CoA reductase-like NADH-dependent reductase (Old Yellow Enzyme family) [Stella humosa]|uniref:2,4-dienoyl-CoA reductase-like NADH-dependent reductase (Old Yellow Enzyme family) n=1 Tax=Stella humosa TaxID=94 RepID=A0A3N1KUX1_9PROT|nr:NADH:flavin oxidoreductase/NADH oxidase [Stella humosa]ROP83774.1 2,4-dienoyl-CoA reductase-like NADH-dependent reductase (Old Yellow Enzyme family) [Stella humosa]BBK32965.1 NADH:flavin oxidoreductase / NADH oxidase [Stella humosa]